MNDIFAFSAFSVFLVGLMYALFFSGNLAPVPALGFILVTMAMLLWWVVARLQRKWSSMSPSDRAAYPLLNELRWFFVLGAIFFTVDLFPHVILILMGYGVQTVSTAHSIAHIFLFIYNIMAARLAMSFFNPRLKNKVTLFVAAISIAALIASVLHPDHFVYIPGSQYPLLSSDAFYAACNMISNVASCGIFGVYLVWKGLTAATGGARWRAVLMGVGIFCEVPVGYYIHYGTSVYVPVILYTFFTAWALLTGVSALYTIKQPRMAAPVRV